MAGFYEGSDLADKTFTGFRLNNKNGHLNIETINDGQTPVVLPQDNVIDENDYKQWFWTKDTVSFRWGANGHLQMVML